MQRTMDDALALMRDLRARCDWDRVQTHSSLRPYLIEEAHEVDDAIAQGDDATLRDELGDLFLQVLFHSVVAEERGAFTMQDVAGALVAKMQARHPHLYGDGIKRSWESMKAEKAKRSTLEDGLPSGLPSLHRAHRLQDRAAGVGFDWPNALGPLEKVREEIDELAAQGVLWDALQDEAEAKLGKPLDAFDLICHVAFDQPPLSRRERADNVKKRNYFAKYQGAARQVLEVLLDKYADTGIAPIEDVKILQLPAFSQIGAPVELVNAFGGKAGYTRAVSELQTQLYALRQA